MREGGGLIYDVRRHAAYQKANGRWAERRLEGDGFPLSLVIGDDEHELLILFLNRVVYAFNSGAAHVLVAEYR